MIRPPVGICLPCTVTRVIDGDTVEVTLPGSQRPLAIRLLDCWAPERKTPRGDLAKVYAEDVIEEAEETHLFVPAPEDCRHLLADLFSFGRLLGHIFIGASETLSERMVRTGHAKREKQ